MRTSAAERNGMAAPLLATILTLSFSPTAFAHDIPNEIIIQAFVKPEGNQLHFLVRLPLTLLLDMNLPKRGPGYLDLAHVEDDLQVSAAVTAKQIVLYEEETELNVAASTTRISLPSDKSFASYSKALAHIHGSKLPTGTDIFWNQGFFDVHLEYPIQSDRANFSLDVRVTPGLREHLTTVVLFMPLDGSVRVYKLAGNAGRVALDPRWHQAAWLFVKSGFFHILEGIYHLLFLLCVVIPLRRFRSLLLVVTSFTIAHSITLILSALSVGPEGPWFPPLVETLIAASIVYMAIENIFAVNLRWRWLITFAFGLVHGFGFSFGLRETMQFAGAHLLLSLLSFNVGVELGQIAVLVVLVPALTLLFRHLTERMVTIVLSLLVAHTAWHWMVERGAELGHADWPVPAAALVTTLARWLLLLLLVGGAVWLVARGRLAVETSRADEDPA